MSADLDAAAGSTNMANGINANTSPQGEIQSLDFGKLIGGPLRATIDAQCASALNTLTFVTNVGFKSSTKTTSSTRVADQIGEPVMVTFNFNRRTAYGVSQPQKFTLPLLCMIPIPNIRVQECSIDFNVKITSMFSQSLDYQAQATVNTSQMGSGSQSTGTSSGTSSSSSSGSNTGGDGTQTGGDEYYWVGSLATTLSNQSTTQQGYDIKREYSMGIKVLAIQDELPAGLERLLALLESQIGEAMQAPSAVALATAK